MLDVKEGDRLALPMGMLTPPKRLTVVRVLSSRIETDDGNAWNRKNGRRWGGKASERDTVTLWLPHHTLMVEAAEARRLAWRIEERLRICDLPNKVKASALSHLRHAAKTLGMEVE